MMRAARFSTPSLLVIQLLVVAPGLTLLSGCPDDTQPGTDTVDTTDPLPDGQQCEAGTVVACIEERTPNARFCAADGVSTFVDKCPGEDGICFQDKCINVDINGGICLPGEVQACVAEGGKEALICNQSRTAFVPQICKGDDGLDSQCRDKACTTCFPGVKKCGDEQTVLVCKPDGSDYEVFSRCNGSSQICTGQFCEELCERNIKFNSYIGCDYFAVDLDNAFVPGGNEGFFDAAGAQFAVVVANPPDATLPAIVEVNQLEGGVVEKVLFDSKGNPLPTEPLMPGELRTLKLPRRDVNGTTIGPLAYKVSANVPIIAYQFNPLENENVFSNDASLLLPAALLGQEYIVMTREQTFNELRSYITVVGILEGETTVAVTVAGPTQPGIAYEGDPNRQAAMPHMNPGETKIFKINQYDVLNLETDRPGADLTGTRVVADKRVAVFGGSEAANAPNTARCINIDPVTSQGVCEWDKKTTCRTLLDCVNAGFNTCCADHLEQQMFPLKTWGSSYIASKSWDRGLSKDIYRIIAGADNTRIVLVPPQPNVVVPILQRGGFFEFESSGNFEVRAQDKKPILVGQFLAAQDAPDPNVGGVGTAGDAGTGDPAFMLLIPLEQYRTDFVVLAPAEYAANYINVTVPTGASVQVDGEDIPPGFFTLIGSGEYSVYRQLIVPGTHTIRSSERAGVIVYGWDQYVSYAYTGGTDLQEIRTENPLTPGN
ncbi:MAG: IgGFc-binding protein [Deltaproteobacteria bacterium]|nr:IgGFc-binding protein [Deltaproteobacteria bacterium]